MGQVQIFEGPENCTRRELAEIAFHESGLYDNKAFSDFWIRYQELLVQKLGYEAQYLGDALKDQGQDRSKNHADQLRYAVPFKGNNNLAGPKGCKCPNSHVCKAICGVPYEKMGEIERNSLFCKIALSLSLINFLLLLVHILYAF